MDANETRFEDIKVSKGTYHVTHFADTGATMVHFIYGGRGHDFIAIDDGSVYNEMTKGKDGIFVHAKTPALRESLHELQSVELPADIKKILAEIK
jgi:hypothetical protein